MTVYSDVNNESTKAVFILVSEMIELSLYKHQINSRKVINGKTTLFAFLMENV
jgi:hypothetical protein